MTTDSVRQEKGDLISREKALSAIRMLYPDMPIVNVFNAFEKWKDKYKTYLECEDVIKIIPSAQKKGHWNFVGDNLFKCTCCGEMYTTQQLNGLRVYDKDPYCPFFCPHCGADMRKEGEENG